MKTNKNSKVWEEWMGYSVHYMHWNDEGPFIDPDTSFGVSKGAAMDTMKKILQSGRCAWLVKVDPEFVGDVPF